MSNLPKHPRDTFITVYGRKPVLEVLEMPNLKIDKVLIARKAKGDIMEDILRLCKKKGIEPQYVTPEEVSRISKNPKQDQGVVADVLAPSMDHANTFFQQKPVSNSYVMCLDGVTTPANMGMVIRTATGLGIDGILVPLKGSSKLNPLVVKASAGVVFRSKLLKCERLIDALKLAKSQGYKVYGLAGEQGTNIYKTEFYKYAIFVMGNESEGISEDIRPLVDYWLTIPMNSGVESLNVACAATVVVSELSRRKT